MGFDPSMQCDPSQMQCDPNQMMMMQNNMCQMQMQQQEAMQMQWNPIHQSSILWIILKVYRCKATWFQYSVSFKESKEFKFKVNFNKTYPVKTVENNLRNNSDARLHHIMFPHSYKMHYYQNSHYHMQVVSRMPRSLMNLLNVGNLLQNENHYESSNVNYQMLYKTVWDVFNSRLIAWCSMLTGQAIQTHGGSCVRLIFFGF